MPETQPIVYPIEMRGLNSLNPATTVYPDSPDLSNVRKTRAGAVAKRDGFTTYNATAMPATTRAITGIAQFNRRDTTTRYTIVGTQEKLFVAPTSGAWTTLASGLSGTATDYWDFAVFNNEIIGVNGVATPQISDGTAAGTGSLTNQASTQSRTAMTSAQSLTAGLHQFVKGKLIGITGASVAGGFDGITQVYDTIGDAWATKTRNNIQRDEGMGFTMNHFVYAVSGTSAASAFTATVEEYNPILDAWRGRTNITTSLRQAVGEETSYLGYILTGNNDAAAAGWVTTNYEYDPVTDAWKTKTAITSTARRLANGFSISNTLHVVSGRTSAGPDNNVTTHDEYNPFTDGWTSLTAITAARRQAGGTGAADNLGYVMGGFDSTGTAQTTIYSYNRVTNAWSTSSAVLGTARVILGAAADSWWMYMAGGAVGADASAVTERYNVSPAAPVAFYVETVRGYVVLARTSSFPSRLFYSLPGNSRIWDPSAFIDVNPDDGDWITGMFVYRNELYVSKTDRIFRIPFSRLDPVRGDQEVLPLPDVPGTVSNRSIVVTDQGVFYLAEDGFRVFDGATSKNISNKIQPTLNGYVQSRMKYCAGIWNTATDEIWWSLTSTGSTHDRIVVYNLKWQEWYIWSGIAAESLAIVEDANDIDQVLFGTGSAADGKLYLAGSTNADNGAAISAYYQSGWFYPAGLLTEFCPRELFLMTTRDGAWNLTVQTRRLFSATNQTNDTDVNLLSGTYPDRYFQDATEQRARIALGMDNNGYAQSIRFANANASETFTVIMAVMTGHAGIGGYPVV